MIDLHILLDQDTDFWKCPKKFKFKGGGGELDKSSKLNLAQVDSCSSHKCKTPYKYSFDFCSHIFRENDFK